MKQFTSHLDFSLTKKRLVMMGKKKDRLLSAVKVGFLLPVLSLIALIYCSSSNESELTTLAENMERGIRNLDNELIEAGNYYPAGPNPLIADTILYLRKTEINLPIKKFYSENGNLFSGTQNWFYENSGSLDQTIEIENGVIRTATRFHGDGSEFLKSEYYEQQGDTSYHRFYENGELESSSKQWSYQKDSILFTISDGLDSNGNTFYSETEHGLTSTYQQINMYKNNLLSHYQYKDDEKSTIKSYYDNGQLMSEATALNNGSSNYFAGDVQLHGLQIVYRENGELIKKEIYENGELIEKIK